MSTTDKLKEDLRHVATDIEELLKVTAGQGGERLSEARERLQTVLQNARSELDDLGSVAVERARQAARDTDRYVHEHAWTSVGVAAGVGLLVGYILGRR